MCRTSTRTRMLCANGRQADRRIPTHARCCVNRGAGSGSRSNTRSDGDGIIGESEGYTRVDGCDGSRATRTPTPSARWARRISSGVGGWLQCKRLGHWLSPGNLELKPGREWYSAWDALSGTFYSQWNGRSSRAIRGNTLWCWADGTPRP